VHVERWQHHLKSDAILLNSLNVIQIVDGKKNVKRVKIRKEIEERRKQTIPRSVPRGRFDYCSIQILIL